MTCYFEDSSTLVVILGCLAIPFLCPLCARYILYPIYKFIADFCLSPELGVFLIFTCWIGFEAKIYCVIYEFIPLIFFSIIPPIVMAVGEFSSGHILHGIIIVIFSAISTVAFYFVQKEFIDSNQDNQESQETQE